MSFGVDDKTDDGVGESDCDLFFYLQKHFKTRNNLKTNENKIWNTKNKIMKVWQNKIWQNKIWQNIIIIIFYKSLSMVQKICFD